MSADKSFRGTLLALQNKTKRDPDSYVDEFRTQLRHFDAVVKSVLNGGGGTAGTSDVFSSQFIAVMHFVSQVAYCYPDECKELPQRLIALLRHCKESLQAETRLAIVNCLLLLRNKNVASASETLPVLFELLEARDKNLRKVVLGHIVGDIRRVNLPGAKEGSAKVNKYIQSFLFGIMEEDDAVQARGALTVMIDLYRRQLWCDERTVQVIAKACFSKHTLLLRMALHFFMMQMPKFSSVGSDSDDDVDPGRAISRLKHKMKHTAKTVKRERVLKNKVESLKKRFDADWRESRDFAKQLVDPIRLLQDPQGFAERLLSKLTKTTERFEVRLLMMSVLARTVSEHELVLLGVFPLFERYLEPTQLHSTNVLALMSTCVNRMVPPDALESAVRTIADRFINDRSDRDSITIGINSIREICKRQPLAMNADLLTDLVAYKQRRGERGVIMAARSLLQLYRDVNPELLPVKLRGSKSGPAGSTAAPRFGASAPLTNIPGLEALFGDAEEQADAAAAEHASEQNGSDNDDDDDDGEWELVSHDSSAEEDEDDEEGEEAEADSDAEVPQLVPIRAAKAQRPPSHVAESVDSESSEVDAAMVRPSANGFVVADDLWVESSGDEEDEGSFDDEEDDGDDDDDGENLPSSREEALPNPPAKRRGHRAEQPAAAAPARKAAPVAAPNESDDSSSSGSGEWVNVSDSDGDIDFGDSDDDDDDDDDVDDTDSAAEDSDNPWADDAVAKPARATSSAGVSTVGANSVATMRTLTDAEFAKLRQLQTGVPAGKTKSKVIEKQERMNKKDALVRDIGERGQLLDPSAIESFTTAKRTRDREAKIEAAQQKRLENNPFQARKKKKTKLNTTHREKQKIGKLYQMTKRSARVALKIKRSVEERRDHAKDMKKKSTKFRIARGWKA